MKSFKVHPTLKMVSHQLLQVYSRDWGTAHFDIVVKTALWSTVLTYFRGMFLSHINLAHSKLFRLKKTIWKSEKTLEKKDCKLFCVSEANQWDIIQHPRQKRLTSAAAVLLITAVHAVRVRVTSPADRDAVTTLTLELVVVTLQITAML